MTAVLGIDSSTQSTKALLCDAADGMVLAQRSAPHPLGSEVDPRAWLPALAAAATPLLDRAAAVSVGGQQHGMVALGAGDSPVRHALLWNDTRSADAARELVEEMGGPQACAEQIGSVMVASFTASKLRWLRDHEPDAAARTRRVLLPHDYVSLHLAAPGTAPFTDAGDASGTGYYDPARRAWRPDLAAAAIGHEVDLPQIVDPGTVAAATRAGAPIASGTGDNMAAALGIGLEPGDVMVSLGTSGVASSVSRTAVSDGTGAVTGFADAAGGFLPMTTTINAAGILDLQCRWLGIDHDELGRLALRAPAGAHGVTLLPYYGGERSPNRPSATGTWHGLTPSTSREDLARAAVEAMLCSLADAVDRVTSVTAVPVRRLLLVGGASRNEAVRTLAPAILGHPVHLPAVQEYVALGAARQAAWALAGTAGPPEWPTPVTEVLTADPQPDVREAYAALRDATASW